MQKGMPRRAKRHAEKSEKDQGHWRKEKYWRKLVSF
jgi:hypothetical protein